MHSLKLRFAGLALLATCGLSPAIQAQKTKPTHIHVRTLIGRALAVENAVAIIEMGTSDVQIVYRVLGGESDRTALMALALGIAMRDREPFLGALLLMVFISEGAAEYNHELSIRPLVAAIADLAVLALIFI